MREVRKGLGLGGIGLLSIACCVGLPLIVAAGFSVAAFAWVGGIAIGAIALAAALTLFAVRIRTRRSCKVFCPSNAKEPSVTDYQCCTPGAWRGEETMGDAATTLPLVEILYFDGCPNHHPRSRSSSASVMSSASSLRSGS